MPGRPGLRIGLIGAGFMGKAHAIGFATARTAFDLPMDIELRTVADITEEAAAAAAGKFGFARWTGDWRTMVRDPDIDLIDITAPNALHREMALAAIAAGKHVYCEKPLATNVPDAREMADAAEARGVKTQVGFNYLCNPVLRLAKEMIAAGELGRIRSYRGLHCEDYMADPGSPFGFRHEPEGGGALADIGSHALATAEFLLGPVAEVMGDCATIIAERPDGRGGRRRVAVDDIALGRHRPQDAARFRGLWERGIARVQPGTAERASLLLRCRRAGAARLSQDRGRARASALRQFLRGSGTPDRLQRPQGHRGCRVCRRARRPRSGAVRFSRRPAHPDARGSDPAVIGGAALDRRVNALADGKSDCDTTRIAL